MWYIQAQSRLHAAQIVPETAFLSKINKAKSIPQSSLKHSFNLGNYTFKSKESTSKIIYVYLGNVDPNAAPIAVFEFQPFNIDDSKGHTVKAITFNYIELKDTATGADIIRTVLDAGVLNTIRYTAILSNYMLTVDSFNAFTLLLKQAFTNNYKTCFYSRALECYVNLSSVVEWVKASTRSPGAVRKDLQALVFKKGFSAVNFDTISFNDYLAGLKELSDRISSSSSRGAPQQPLFGPIPNDKLNPNAWSVLSQVYNPGKVVGPLFLCRFKKQDITKIKAEFDKRRYSTDALNDLDIANLSKIGITPKLFEITKLSAVRVNKQIASILCFFVLIPKDANQQDIIIIRQFVKPNA